MENQADLLSRLKNDLVRVESEEAKELIAERIQLLSKEPTVQPETLQLIESGERTKQSFFKQIQENWEAIFTTLVIIAFFLLFIIPDFEHALVSGISNATNGR